MKQRLKKLACKVLGHKYAMDSMPLPPPLTVRIDFTCKRCGHCLATVDLVGMAITKSEVN